MITRDVARDCRSAEITRDEAITTWHSGRSGRKKFGSARKKRKKMTRMSARLSTLPSRRKRRRRNPNSPNQKLQNLLKVHYVISKTLLPNYSFIFHNKIRTNLEGLLVAGSSPPRRLRRYINRDYWPYLADGTQLLPGRISRRLGQLRHADAQQVKIRLNNQTQYRREEEFHFKFDLIITRKFFVVFLLNPTKRIDPLYLDIYIYVKGQRDRLYKLS